MLVENPCIVEIDAAIGSAEQDQLVDVVGVVADAVVGQAAVVVEAAEEHEAGAAAGLRLLGIEEAADLRPCAAGIHPEIVQRAMIAVEPAEHEDALVAGIVDHGMTPPGRRRAHRIRLPLPVDQGGVADADILAAAACREAAACR